MSVRVGMHRGSGWMRICQRGDVRGASVRSHVGYKNFMMYWNCGSL